MFFFHLPATALQMGRGQPPLTLLSPFIAHLPRCSNIVAFREHSDEAQLRRAAEAEGVEYDLAHVVWTIVRCGREHRQERSSRSSRMTRVGREELGHRRGSRSVPAHAVPARPAPRRRETARDALEEPLLSSFLHACVLSHATLEDTLAFVLAKRLARCARHARGAPPLVAPLPRCRCPLHRARI